MTPDRLERLRAVLDMRQTDLTVIMEDTRKTHNIAAVLRTCEAVGVFEAHAVNSDGAVPNHRFTSAGSRKWLRLRTHEAIEPAINSLRDADHQILATTLSATAVDYREIDYTRPVAILLGSELPGVSEAAMAQADVAVKIPMHGMVESLNVSVAAALLLYEARRQRETAGMYARGSALPTAVYDTVLFEWAWPDIARRCRERGLPYPGMREDGQLAANPFEGQPDG